MALSKASREKAEAIFFDLIEGDTHYDDAEVLARAEGEQDVAAEVRALLAIHLESSSLLPAPDPIESTTTEIGPYRLTGELGRGGMGTVYRAERTGDYSMEVAIKVLPPGLAGTAARERFVAERRMLAKLEHPGIARLLDGGWTADGRPYIVMERVDGVAISEHVRDLNVSDKLELFLQVAAAVQYAHRHLIVHRDLKPSNILVSKDGRAKLLDFGIAKILDEDESSESLTRTGERLLTPDYASPEQVRGETVTTASDVYQLGVVLYEMLTGVLPFRLKGRPLVEVERTLSDTIPKAPSLRIGEGEGELDGRRTARALRGDLDNIIMKALRKEPESRYPSPEAMAADVRRHLDGLPVLARGNTTWYLARKFARRHSGSVTAAAILLVSLLSFSIMSVRQASQIADERDKVAQERDIARYVNAFMVELFEAAKPENDPSREISVRDVLNVGAMRIEANLQETPAIRAAFMNVIGSAYGIIGDRRQGERLLRQALAIRSEIDDRSLESAETMNDLGVVQLRANRIEEADTLLTGALEIRIRQGAPEADIATTQVNLASVRERQRRFEEADSLYSRALRVFEKDFGRSNRSWAIAVNNLALLRRATGRRSEAEALLREQLPIRRRFAAQEPSLLGLTLTNLGTVLHERGAHAEAEEALREAVEIYSEQDRSRPTEASARQNLAAAIGAQGRWKEAEEQFLNALAVRESIYPANDMRIATVRNNIASMWRRADSPERAEPDFRKAVEIARSNPNADWGARAQMEVNWGWTLLALDRSAEAGTVFGGLIAAAESGEAVPRRIVFDTYWGLGRAQAAQAAFAAAEESFQSAISMVREILREGDPLEWRLQVQYAEFLILADRPGQAVAVLSVAVDSLEATEDPNAAMARELLEGLGRE